MHMKIMKTKQKTMACTFLTSGNYAITNTCRNSMYADSGFLGISGSSAYAKILRHMSAMRTIWVRIVMVPCASSTLLKASARPVRT